MKKAENKRPELDQRFDTLERYIGGDVRYFTKDLSKKRNYNCLGETGNGKTMVETWGGRRSNFKNIRVTGIDDNGVEYKSVTLNDGSINLAEKWNKTEGTREIVVQLNNPVKSLLKGHGAAVACYEMVGHDILKMVGGVTRTIKLRANDLVVDSDVMEKNI